MSLEEQRIKIAEYCQRPELEAVLWDEKLAYWAMHEAEKVLTTDKQHETYWVLLVHICDPGDESDYNSRWICAHATAAQRAEAFLKTLGLWVEEPVSAATVEGLR